MNKVTGLFLFLLIITSACASKKDIEMKESKAVVYQVFTRLFGNTNETNKPWGTIEENGVGKFADFTPKALKSIKDLGVTHVWYTGVPHHDVITDYTKYGISNDDPDVVKGRAGSPYAVKDYYNVNPDLAVDPAKRLEEFEALVARTHAVGMKVIIDIVPNHVARNYKSLTNPEGVRDFGADDDTSVDYHVDNNYYYIPGEKFEVPDENYTTPLGGLPHPLADGLFDENPAKWTGNGSRSAKPSGWDWYETVKINYGVRPDGSYDFEVLPDDYATQSYQAHFEFWKGKAIPSSWVKFRDIALYWLDKGVDGFRYDMAEMVPVEFWSYMNSSVKMKNSDAFLLAEVYNPDEYRNYISKGKMDYLYDKVELYDHLKVVMQGKSNTDRIAHIQAGLGDIEHHMLHFLENHDEQRIASPEFAGSAAKGKPAMVVSATISTAPTMIYFGQEVGERGALNSGFGTASRTSIFDYCGVPHHQRWYNGGKLDGGQLTDEEQELREFYKTLLNYTIHSPALMGAYKEIHGHNRYLTSGYSEQAYSFLRWKDNDKVLVVSNFSDHETHHFDLQIPNDLSKELGLESGKVHDQLENHEFQLSVDDDNTIIPMTIHPLQSFIIEL